jgi:hypothetical protein
MTSAEISNIRLNSQQISGTKFKTAKEIVGWMGALQAQDYSMSKWSVGIRLPNSTDLQIEAAIDKAEIIRTHLMRPTWHLVSADDIYWMLELTAPQIKPMLNSRNKELELSETIYTKCNNLIEKALAKEKHLTREELVGHLEKAKIVTDNNRASHIIMRAELDGIVCSGITKNQKQTYALLNERVSKTITLVREEALAKLANCYFSSHCPATLKDFVWWSGLSMKDAKSALEIVKINFVSETINSEVYWFTNSFSLPKNEPPSLFLLPAFDEYIISYKNRNDSLSKENQLQVLTNNGIFKPTIVLNGQVTGVWKRTVKKDTVRIEIAFFEQQPKSFKPLLEKAAEVYRIFLDKKAELIN